MTEQNSAGLSCAVRFSDQGLAAWSQGMFGFGMRDAAAVVLFLFEKKNRA